MSWLFFARKRYPTLRDMVFSAKIPGDVLTELGNAWQEVRPLAEVYANARDRIEAARDTCETVWRDWPVMALGLIMRGNGLVPEDHPEIAEYRARQTARLRGEYLRRRWRDGRQDAAGWYERELADLTRDIDRRSARIDREQLARTLSRGDGDILVVETDPQQGHD